jgi:hypothetical protein
MVAVLSAIVATGIVLLIVLAWTWQYTSTRARWQTAALHFMCPYCRYRVNPGDYIAEGSRGWGHWDHVS